MKAKRKIDSTLPKCVCGAVMTRFFDRDGEWFSCRKDGDGKSHGVKAGVNHEAPPPTWEEVIALARTVSNELRMPLQAHCLATALIKFHDGILDGTRLLPASWQVSAVHMGGYTLSTESAPKCMGCKAPMEKVWGGDGEWFRCPNDDNSEGHGVTIQDDGNS